MWYQFTPLPTLVGFPILVTILFVLWRQKRNIKTLFFTGLFGFYLLLLITAVLFPIPGYEPMEGWTRLERAILVLSQVNLIPFKYLDFTHPHFNPGTAFPELFQNILLSVPFGFLVNFLTGISPRNMLILALAVGFSTEFSQLLVGLFITQRPFRVVDITDVILNAIGFLLGYMLYRIIIWLRRKITRENLASP